MISRFIEQKPAIDVVALNEKSIEKEMKPLGPAVMIALERMSAVLKPIKQFTEQVCRLHQFCCCIINKLDVE
jgi:hypothetical protein